jgi:hypothetical protein
MKLEGVKKAANGKPVSTSGESDSLPENTARNLDTAPRTL